MTRRGGDCNAKRCTTEWWRACGCWAGRSTPSGIGDAGQTSPLGGGRSWPQVRRPVQLRARPATLLVAFERVAGNRGANTPGVDGLTVADVEELVGVSGFLDDLCASVKAGTFRPLPVRERKISKPGGSGKVRKLGIPTEAA